MYKPKKWKRPQSKNHNAIPLGANHRGVQTLRVTVMYSFFFNVTTYVMLSDGYEGLHQGQSYIVIFCYFQTEHDGWAVVLLERASLYLVVWLTPFRLTWILTWTLMNIVRCSA